MHFQFHDCQERHHKVIRSFMQNRLHQSNCEKGLAEDLIAHSIRDLRTLPAETGLVRPYDASKRMMTMLRRIYGDSISEVKTSAEARSGSIKVKPGDAVFYYDDDGALSAGDVWFFASECTWGEVAFVGRWARLRSGICVEFWKFKIHHDVIMLPINEILDTSAWHKGTTVATVLVPPALVRQ